jgi:hypothetical protein
VFNYGRNNGTRQAKFAADKPVSRILFDARTKLPCAAVIIPLDPGSYPRVITSWASSPLLFGLAPRRVCRAVPIARDAVGSCPTVSPLPCAFTFDGRLNADHRPTDRRLFLRLVTEANCTGGLFSVALSVAGRFLEQPPGVTRRVAPSVCNARHPGLIARSVRAEDCGVRTFLPAGHLAKADPAITRPARRHHYNLAKSKEPIPRLASI